MGADGVLSTNAALDKINQMKLKNERRAKEKEINKFRTMAYSECTSIQI